MARLRAPGGCPWDREQTFDTIKPYLLEETYEVLDAIDGAIGPAWPKSWAISCCRRSSSRRWRPKQGTFAIDDALDAINRKADPPPSARLRRRNRRRPPAT